MVIYRSSSDWAPYSSPDAQSARHHLSRDVSPQYGGWPTSRYDSVPDLAYSESSSSRAYTLPAPYETTSRSATTSAPVHESFEYEVQPQHDERLDPYPAEPVVYRPPAPNHDVSANDGPARPTQLEPDLRHRPITFRAYTLPAASKHSNESDTGNAQRQRIQVACARCRRRKIRCSGAVAGGNSCQACRDSGIDVRLCTFDRVGTIRKYEIETDAALPTTPSTSRSSTSSLSSSASAASLPLDTGMRPVSLYSQQQPLRPTHRANLLGIQQLINQVKL